MATTQIPLLPNAIALNGTEPFIAVQAGVSVQVSAAQIAAYAASVAPANVSSFSAGSTGFTPSSPSTGAIVLAGTLNVAHGGTGAVTLTANGVLLGNGTSAVTAITGTSSQVLVGGSPPAFGAIPSSLAVTSFSAGTTGLTPNSATTGAVTLAGTLVLGNGGTGFSTYTKGDLIYSSATNTLAKLGIGATGTVLTPVAGVPVWTAPPGGGGTTASGSVTLTASSPAAQAITTTDYGQFVKLPDATTMASIKSSSNFNVFNAGGYPLKVLDGAANILGYIYPGDSSMVGCSDSSTAAGVWDCTGLEVVALTARFTSTLLAGFSSVMRAVVLDADRTLFTVGSGGSNLYGVVYTASTASFGTLTLIRTAGGNHSTIKTATDQVLVCSCNATTAFQAVILSFAGNVITVNTAATATNSANLSAVSATFSYPIAVGSAWVVAYLVGTPANTMRAMTISGTTVTIGGEATMTGTLGTFVSLYAIDSTNFITMSMTTGTAVYARPFSISGTTLSAGTEASVTGLTGCTGMITSPISGGVRWVMIYRNAAGTNIAASIISVAGGVATLSTVTLITGGTSVNVAAVAAAIVDSSKLILFYSAVAGPQVVNILVDSSGTASAGTQANLSAAAVAAAISASGNVAKAFLSSNTNMVYCVVDYSGASPTVTAITSLVTSAGMTINQPYDSTRSMGLLIGAQTFSVEQLTTAAASRMGVAKANGMTNKVPKFMSEFTLAGGYRTAMAAIGQNKLWAFSASIYTDFGEIALVEGVT